MVGLSLYCFVLRGNTWIEWECGWFSESLLEMLRWLYGDDSVV